MEVEQMKTTGLTIATVSLSVILPLSTGVYAADANIGKEKATQCASCHGVNGEGNGTPKTKISGMKAGDFSKYMKEYKTGARKNAMMEMFAKKLNDQDVADLAAYYASKK